jgi:hypothetical protein
MMIAEAEMLKAKEEAAMTDEERKEGRNVAFERLRLLYIDEKNGIKKEKWSICLFKHDHGHLF